MNIQGLAGKVGIVIIILLLFATAAMSIGYNRGEKGLFGGDNGSGGSGGGCGLFFPSGAGSDEQIATALNKYIAEKNSSSPLKDMGLYFAQSGRRANINPAFIVAISRKESSFGINIPDTTYNPFGRTATSSQEHVEVNGRKWCKWDNWQEGIFNEDTSSNTHCDDEGHYLNRYYIEGKACDGAACDTIDKLMNKYAPPTENDTNTYVQQVKEWMEEMTTLASGALGSCGGTGDTPTNPGGWIWPVIGTGPINSGFFCYDRGNHLHNGIDVSAPRGTEIKASRAGKVIKVVNSSAKTGNGTYVTIDHLDGFYSIYIHMVDGSPTVSEGNTVNQGDVIGQVNDTGNSFGNHIHFVIKTNNQYVDPIDYLPFKEGVSNSPNRTGLCKEINVR